MKQVLRKGLKDIVVEDVPDPIVQPHHVLVRPEYSLISAGTETASIHRDGILREVADNPSHLRTVLRVARAAGPLRTAAEVLAKFRDYAVLGYSGAGIVVDRHPTVTDIAVGARVAYGGEGTGHAEYIVTGSNLVAPVPESVGFDHASFATLGSIAMNAVRIANIGLGDRVAVIGLGVVGQLTLQLARLQGAETIGIDLLPDRVAIALRLGADHALVGGETVRRRSRSPNRRHRRGLCDRGGRSQVSCSEPTGLAHLSRPGANRRRGSRGPALSVGGDVPQGDSALHGACLWSGKLRPVL